jgi:hypothetical protein
VDDSINAKRPAPPDSAKKDSTAAPRQPAMPGVRPRAGRPAAEPLTSRPPLTEKLVIRPAEPWQPGARYTVEIRGVRNVTGVAGDVIGTLVVPERAPRDTLAAPADSLEPGADTTRAGADSIPPARAKPAPTKPGAAKPQPTKPRPTKPAPTKPQ